MAHLISFLSQRFDPRDEPRNPISPMSGHAVLGWLREALAGSIALTEPDAADWGWCATGSFAGRRYLVGASSGGSQNDAPPIEWIIQIHTERSLFDRALGRNQLAPDDALTTLVFDVVCRAPECEHPALTIDDGRG